MSKTSAWYVSSLHFFLFFLSAPHGPRLTSSGTFSFLLCVVLCTGWNGLLIMRCEALVGTRSYPAAYSLATEMLRRDPNDGDAM